MGQPKEILPNLWLYEAVSADISVRGVVIVGERQAVVWDTLTHPRDVSRLTAILGDKPYYVIYSHGDWDHCWGTSGFKRKSLGVIGHDECRRRFSEDVPEILCKMQLTEPDRWGGLRLAAPTMTFNSSLYLDLGGLTFELHHLPGHTSDCIVGWIPERGVLLGGDAIETPLPVVNSRPALEGWLSALQNWADTPELRRAIPAHGTASGRQALDQTVAYLRALTGDQDFKLPRRLTKFYRETHQRNLQLAAEKPDGNE